MSTIHFRVRNDIEKVNLVGKIDDMWQLNIYEAKLHQSLKRVFLISKCGLTWRDCQMASHLHDASESHNLVWDLWRLELTQSSTD